MVKANREGINWMAWWLEIGDGEEIRFVEDSVWMSKILKDEGVTGEALKLGRKLIRDLHRKFLETGEIDHDICHGLLKFLMKWINEPKLFKSNFEKWSNKYLEIEVDEEDEDV